MPLQPATTDNALARRTVFSAVAAVLALPFTVSGREADPVLAAIEAAREAREAFAHAVDDLRGAEHDKARLRAADEAGERDSEARNALALTRPATREGLHALIRFHAEDVCALEPHSVGAVALREISAIIPAEATPAPIRPGPSLFARVVRIAGEVVGLTVMCGGSAALAKLSHLIP